MSERRKVNINSNGLGLDAWGRNKTVKDYSMFHGMFTLEVPDEMWIECFNGVEVPIKTNATSVNGALNLVSNGGVAMLMSKRHPRYQPNRGLLYSDSGFLDNVSEANTGKLYAVRRTLVDGVVINNKTMLDINEYINPAGGHVRDMQAQWRGVGDFNFFIDLGLIYKDELLGTLDNVSIFNPALPICYTASSAGIVTWGLQTEHSGIFYQFEFDTPQETSLRIGCVDVTSEGGFKENRQRGTANTDEISLSATEQPILALRVPVTIDYNGTQTMNTRDIALRLVSAFSDDNTILRVYYTRDAAKFVGTAWLNENSIASVQYSVDGSIVLVGGVTDLKRIATRRIPAFGSVEIKNPDDQYGDFFLTHGDYIVVTAKAKNQTLGGVSIEWGSEI